MYQAIGVGLILLKKKYFLEHMTFRFNSLPWPPVPDTEVRWQCTKTARKKSSLLDGKRTGSCIYMPLFSLQIPFDFRRSCRPPFFGAATRIQHLKSPLWIPLSRAFIARLHRSHGARDCFILVAVVAALNASQ